MIDTDKYEGHTKGKWILGEYKGRPSIHAGDETFVRNIARGLNPNQTADHNLLVDAPLLLEEVKRLRKLRNEIQATLNDEIVNLEKYGEYGRCNCEGWIEALQYVLGRMDAQGEEE